MTTNFSQYEQSHALTSTEACTGVADKENNARREHLTMFDLSSDRIFMILEYYPLRLGRSSQMNAHDMVIRLFIPFYSTNHHHRLDFLG